MPTVNLKLNGKREFTATEICRLATALDKSPSYFFAPQLNEPLNGGGAN
jgi:transcriptional regulator with XRE-family HTH domain